MKALILAPFAPDQLERLRRRMAVVYEPWTETRMLWDPAELAVRLAEESIEAVVAEVDFLFGEVFEDPSPLRFIGLCRNATNQIDLEAAATRGVTVVNTPGRNANAVAELVIGLALSLARSIPSAHTYVRGRRLAAPDGRLPGVQGVRAGRQDHWHRGHGRHRTPCVAAGAGTGHASARLRSLCHRATLRDYDHIGATPVGQRHRHPARTGDSGDHRDAGPGAARDDVARAAT